MVSGQLWPRQSPRAWPVPNLSDPGFAGAPSGFLPGCTDLAAR